MLVFFSFFHLSMYYSGEELRSIVLKDHPHTLKMHNISLAYLTFNVK